MALVPGLRGSAFTEDRPQATRSRRGRVLLNDEGGVLNDPRLRPVADPIDIYTRPPQPVQDDGAERLVQALSGLSPALGRFGAVLAEEKQEPNADLNAKVAKLTPAELKQKLDDGSDPELTAGLDNAKGQQLIAAQLARAFVDDARQQWDTGNRDAIDIDQVIARGLQQTLDKYGGRGREYLTNEFIRLTQPGLDRLRSEQAQHRAGVINSGKYQGAADLLSLTIENGKTQKRSPEDIAKAVYGEVSGNAILARLDRKQQLAEVLNVAGRHADAGDVELVRALVNAKGTDGLSLVESRELGTKATALLERADDKARERRREGGFQENLKWSDAAREGTLDRDALIADFKANPGRMSEGFVNALIAQNEAVRQRNLDTVQKIERERAIREAADQRSILVRSENRAAIQRGQLSALAPTTLLKANGEAQEVDAKKRQEMAVEDWLDDSRKHAERRQETPQQRFARELPIVLENGIVHPEWKETLAGGYRTAAQATLSGGVAQVPPRLKESLAIYNDLHAKAPNLIPDLIGGDAGKFYEYMRVATGEMELGLDKAFSAVMQLTKDPVKLKELSQSGSAGDIAKEAKKAAGGSLNLSYVEREIQERALVYSGLGNSTADALRLAREDVDRTHVDINGHFIPAHDKRLPSDFKALVEARLKDYAAKHGQTEGVDWDDLTIAPASSGTGAWEIVYLNGIRVDDRKDGTFTLRDLQEMKRAGEEAARAAVTKNADKKRSMGRQQPDQGEIPAGAARTRPKGWTPTPD